MTNFTHDGRRRSTRSPPAGTDNLAQEPGRPQQTFFGCTPGATPISACSQVDSEECGHGLALAARVPLASTTAIRTSSAMTSDRNPLHM
jgi:hypothetical protein